jgi:NAD(P)-dependent dehydrogenase (short-subunit alcohol dehydrogenase family)
MNLDLNDKVFAIVGGTSGMGFATAEVMAEEGAKLALLCRDEARGQHKADMLRQRLDADVAVFVADGMRSGSIDAAMTAAADHFGGLDGLAVTAGPMQRMAPFTDLLDEDWSSYFESQLMTTVRACRAVLPLLERRGGGNIVVTSAYSIRHQSATLAAYSAMKQAVAGVAKNIAKHWGCKNIRCNCVCPGAIASESLDGARTMAEQKYGDTLSPDAALDKFMLEEWHLDVALQRVGKPREVGELIAFLLSARAAYMTGALINIDGGTDF